MTISALVQHAVDGGASTHDLARRCDDVVSATQWSNWRRGKINEFPKAASVDAAAQALSVPVTAVVLAFAAELGLDVRSPEGLAGRLPAAAANLPASAQDAVLSVVHEMVHLHGTKRPPLRAVARRRKAGERAREQDQ